MYLFHIMLFLTLWERCIKMEEIYQYVTKGRIVIQHDTYNGIEYAITTIGHPCAYIILDRGHPFINQCKMGDFSDLVHGGITFDNISLPPLVSMKDNKHIYGWDYNHYGDCSILFNCEGILWTVDEIMEDVTRMIDYIV